MRHASRAWRPELTLPEMRANLAANGPQLYVGRSDHGLVWAGPQQALLVLGPPRSGKTSSLVVPNVLAAPGPVLVTSTKPDVLQATLAARSQLGHCWLLDPTGSTQPPPGVSRLRWSPVQPSLSWEEALVTARVMTAAARPQSHLGESAHWSERAEALLAPMLHAAALAGAGVRQVLTWALRHDIHTPMGVLAAAGGPADIAVEVLAGILATEERERSGIYSTAAGVLSAYRSWHALELAAQPNFDPASFPGRSDTIYVCAPARYQALMAPVVVAFLEQVRASTYRAAAAGALGLPVTFVLDEVANVAPLPDLPAMVSEGGGQGLLTMACLQDLSQARQRWGRAADGFFSLFGTKVLLPGIGDMATLDAVSRLAGQADRPVRSVTTSAWWSRPSGSNSWSPRRQPRLPVDQAHSLPPSSALVVGEAKAPRPVHLTRWWDYPPFSEAARLQPPAPAPVRGAPAGAGQAATVPSDGHKVPKGRITPLPPSPPPGAGVPADQELTVTWRRVPGYRPPRP